MKTEQEIRDKIFEFKSKNVSFRLNEGANDYLRAASERLMIDSYLAALQWVLE